ncbi:34728_t:CDS:2 [Gigaspora margarita]|uniref:34728_t:CDS:1 n=1 Tax=Gigaspora margarita TaxID=4874 RepID=A0ABN7V968_GIGMA|nr:34728_t:CDS:2 [Gigaspora margarita]
MSPPRRTKVNHVEKTPGHRLKCPRCHCSFVKYEKLEKHLQDIHLTTVQGIRHSQNARQIQHDYDNNTFSFKSNICNQLDKIYDRLMIAKKKYLPLTEHGHPQIGEFSQCHDSITLLKVEICGFNKKQVCYINGILNNKVAAEEKEKVATLVKKLRKEIKKLDYDIGDGYYTESRRLLERENDVLMRRNSEFFEETEATKIRNYELVNNLHLLQQQNVELSKEIEELTNKKATLSEVVYIID